MAIFKIPVLWQMWGVLEVKANSLEEAEKTVLLGDVPLPKEQQYIENSLTVDRESILYGDNKNDSVNNKPLNATQHEEKEANLETIIKLYEFLQGKIPEGFHFVAPPRLTKEQAFSVIYYLQEAMNIVPDSYEQCQICGDLYDSNDSCSALCESCYHCCPHNNNVDCCSECSLLTQAKVGDKDE